MTALAWWANQPEPVRAVLDLANLADNTAMVATFAPGMDDTVTALGTLLVEIDRLGTGDTDLLAQYYDAERIDSRYADELADEKITELKAEVLTTAQLCASVLQVRARRLVAVPA